MKYVFPAVFTPEKNGMYSVYFPDLEGCYTAGDNIADAMYMAEDVLSFTLYAYKRDSQPIPAASASSALLLKDRDSGGS